VAAQNSLRENNSLPQLSETPIVFNDMAPTLFKHLLVVHMRVKQSGLHLVKLRFMVRSVEQTCPTTRSLLDALKLYRLQTKDDLSWCSGAKCSDRCFKISSEMMQQMTIHITNHYSKQIMTRQNLEVEFTIKIHKQSSQAATKKYNYRSVRPVRNTTLVRKLAKNALLLLRNGSTGMIGNENRSVLANFCQKVSN